MGYILKDSTDDSDIENVTFLYNVVPGVSKRSYGINVAALAGISKEILLEAQKVSLIVELQRKIESKIKEVLVKLKSS
ncbi:DNA mismatch repair protein Msh3 [Caerostris extrusa]|nr:DNA mismatch repair protein Msh3 [Caerostris extrusa]